MSKVTISQLTTHQSHAQRCPVTRINTLCGHHVPLCTCTAFPQAIPSGRVGPIAPGHDPDFDKQHADTHRGMWWPQFTIEMSKIRHFMDMVNGYASGWEQISIVCLWKTDSLRLSFLWNPYICDCVDFVVYKFLFSNNESFTDRRVAMWQTSSMASNKDHFSSSQWVCVWDISRLS